MKSESVIYSEYINLPEFQNFRIVAEKFFLLVEQKTDLEKYDYRCELHRILSDLYSLSWKMPELNLQFESNLEDFLPHIDVSKIMSQAADMLGENSLYHEVFNPFHPDDDEPTLHSLVDDISDIYCEIKNAISKIDEGSPQYIEDGIWDILFGRNNHWGNHTVNAIRALHYRNYN